MVELRPRVALAHILLWMTAAACLMAYSQWMPLGTLIPDRSWTSLLFAILFSSFGAIGLAGLLWFLPSLVRGELGQRAPGELWLVAVGVIVIIDCTVLAWSAAQFHPESLDFYRIYVSVYCMFASPLFVVVALIFRGRVVWKLALAAPAIPYAVWGIATFIDRDTAGLGYVQYGQKDFIA